MFRIAEAFCCAENKFVEDEGWHRAAERYSNFLRTRKDRRILFLELGVGYNTPVIIKYPFWQMTAGNRKAVYACLNEGEAVCPDEIMCAPLIGKVSMEKYPGYGQVSMADTGMLSIELIDHMYTGQMNDGYRYCQLGTQADMVPIAKMPFFCYDW